jgi:hypothetical protein
LFINVEAIEECCKTVAGVLGAVSAVLEGNTDLEELEISWVNVIESRTSFRLDTRLEVANGPGIHGVGGEDLMHGIP